MFSYSAKALIVLIALFLSNAVAQDYDKVQINAVKVTENIYMLEGQGGNIGLFFGHQGVFIIDDQFAPLHEKITAKIKEITAGVISENANTFVINTHLHGDHTGGNELMGKAGAVIVAHENVRKRLAVEQFNTFFKSTRPAMPEGGLPIITFTDELTFHLNGDSVNIYHLEPAHTDGDAIIHFTKANVIHGGDIVFIGSYPFIDLGSGGSVRGVIKAVERILSMSDSNTKIIPGHGPLSDKPALEKNLKMLTTIYERVSKLYGQGQTLEQIQAAKPTAEFDNDYQGFVAPDRFVETIFKDLSAKK